MHIFSSFFGHIAHITLGALVGISSLFTPHPRAVVTQNTSPTHTTTPTPLSKSSIAPKKKTVAITTPQTKKLVTPAPLLPPLPQPAATPQPVPQPIAPVPIPVPLPPTVSTDEINTALRKSLVNILCTTKAGGSFRPISGSGVIIDTRGVILTNAHVGQFFLLKDYPTPDNVSCVIRTGSPATPKYNAKLAYIPEQWVRDNATQLKSAEATGTGENDYALLLITSASDGSPLPAQFPAVTLSLDQPSKGDAVVLAAYPAQFLGGATIQMNLYASSAVTPIENVYTFNTGTVDVLSLGSTVVSQSGSSGGGVAKTQDGALVGIIATATEGTSTASRDLRAITLAHIDRSLQKFGKGGLAPFLLNGDIQQKTTDFNTIIAPNLTKLLTDALR